MDLLSQLTAFVRIGGELQALCPITQGWLEDCPAVPAGVVPFHIVLTGACVFELPQAKLRQHMAQGDIVVLPHGAHHRLLPVAPSERVANPRILCGTFTIAAVRESALLGNLPEHLIVQTAGRDDFTWLPAMLDMMEAETRVERPGTQGVVSDLSSAVFTLVLRAWLESGQMLPGALAMMRHPILQKVALLILERPEHNWTVEALAGQVHMSRATLLRLVAKYDAPTPQQLQTELRMHRAAQHLARGNVSAGRVAEMVGYESEAAFNRAFKRAFDITPGRYAQRGRVTP